MIMAVDPYHRHSNEVERAYHYLKPHILFYNNGLSIWHSLSDIKHIKVNHGRWSAILKLIKLKFVRAYPYPKTHLVL